MACRQGRSRALLLALASALVPAISSAQSVGSGASFTPVTAATSIAPLDRFEPAPSGDSFFAIPSADVVGKFRPALAIVSSYAHAPLVLRQRTGAMQKLDWVDHQLLLHALISFEVLQRLKIEIDLPFTLAQGGDTGAVAGIRVTAPSGAGINDVRAGARFAFFHQRGLVPSAALAFSMWFPTGNAAMLSGASAIRFAPALVLGATYRSFLWTATFGRRFQPEVEHSLLGSQTFGGAAVAARFSGLQIGPEFYVSVGSGKEAAKLARDAVSMELLLGARYHLGPLFFGAGGGPGFGQSPGTPSYRLFASLGATGELLRKQSAAPEASSSFAPGSSGSYRPAPSERAAGGEETDSDHPSWSINVDFDGDTVPDSEDTCPRVVGDPRPDAYHRGCPPDRDRDGIIDIDDSCPKEPGPESKEPSKNGCPADTDDDGIVDTKDACPNEKGKPYEDPKNNGCPESVRVVGEQIVILQQVHFGTGSDTIMPESFPLLTEVASVIKEHPEIARVAVDGHTDNIGDEKVNLNLSQRRAVAVVKWLVEHGVDARRLEARGFGPRRPIEENTSESGKAKNRRVEFLIRKRTPEGEAGWKDGPV